MSKIKPATELKALREFYKILDAPLVYESRYRRISAFLAVTGMVALYYLFTDATVLSPARMAVAAFISGLCFGLGFWFLQSATQTPLLAAHFSTDSIKARIDELENAGSI